MRKFRLFFAFAALVMMGCNNSSTETPSPTPQEAPFKLKVYDIAAVTATVEVEPADPKARYHTDVLKKSDFEQAQTYGFDDYLAWLTSSLVEQTSSPLNEVVDRISSFGNDGFILTTLTPETEYYAFAVGIDDKGKTTTEVVYERFFTTAKKVSQNSFEVEISGITVDGASVMVTPTNDDPYIVAIEPANTVVDLSGEELADYIIQSNMAWGGLEQMTYSGETVVEHLGKADWNYEVIIFGYEMGAVTTPVERIPFRMEQGGDPAACTFTMSHEFDNFKMYLKTEPSDNTVVYVANSIEESDYQTLLAAHNGDQNEAMGEALESLIEELILDLESRARAVEIITLMGSIEYEMNFKPATQYRQWAVAVDEEGNPSADFVLSEPITTPDEVASDVTIELKRFAWYDGAELAKLYPEQFGNLKSYAVVELEVEPSANAVHWWSYVSLEDLTDRPRRTIINNLLMSPAEPDQRRHLIPAFWGVNTIMGVAQDAEGNFGELLLEVVDLTREGATPASEIDFAL